MPLFKKKAKGTQGTTSKKLTAKKPNKEMSKSEEQVPDKLEVLIKNSKDLKRSGTVKQLTENTPDILAEVDQEEPPSEVAEQTSENVIAEATETISQKKAVFEAKELGLEEEFPEVLVTTCKQRDSVIEPAKSSKEYIPKNLQGIERSTEIADNSKQSYKSNLFTELEINLTVATLPWTDKLLPFQTSVWDSKHGEGEPLMITHLYELIQLYVDIGLANNIVWLATELGHRSKELDESYIKLCKGIAERIIAIRAK